MLKRTHYARADAVAKRLGPASIQISLDTYAHMQPQVEDQAALPIGVVLRQAV